MKIAIMQPYFFPYIGYFQLISCVDKFVFYDDVNFINKGWINRNKILLDEKEFLLTVPLSNSSQNYLINEIKLLNNNKWKKKILLTLEHAYKKAPFYNIVFPYIEDIINSNTIYINDLCMKSILFIIEYLDIKTRIIKSSTIYNNKSLKFESRIIDICKKENSNQYYNLMGGFNLYDKKTFENNLIELNFLSPELYNYKQFNNYFISFLSIIDIIMFNEKKIINKMLKNYTIE